jgi:hypothetical protein
MVRSIALVLFLIIGIFNCKTTIAQPPRGPFGISPQVLADKKLAFHYLALAAKDVKLGGSQFGAAGNF